MRRKEIEHDAGPATLVALLLFAATHELAAAQQSVNTALHPELTVARVAEQAKVVAVLQKLRLDSSTHWHADMAALSSDEQAEMNAVMQEGGIPLGTGAGCVCGLSQKHAEIRYM